MLLGVQDLVVDAALVELAGQPLGVLDRHGAYQHRLAGLTTVHDVVDHRFELPRLGLEDEVALVEAHERTVGGNRHHLKAVDARQFGRLGLGGSGHACQLLVEAEVVLERDRGERLVLLLDRHPLLGLDGLVEPIGPPSSLEHPSGELVHDPNLAVHDDVVLVPLVELLGLQGGVELVDEVGRHLVVEVVDAEGRLDGMDPFLGRGDDALLLVYVVVVVWLQAPDYGGEPLVEGGRLAEPPADDERRPRLVDEDRVDLVHDAEGVAALGLLHVGHGHVVAQVVEAQLVVGPVGDVGRIGGPLLGPVADVG